MTQRPRFIEVEGHVLKIANIVRVSAERSLKKESYDDDRHKSLPVVYDEKSHQEKKEEAYQNGYGEWVAHLPYLRSRGGLFEDNEYDYKSYKFTLCIEYIVIMRGSRPVTLYREVSYKNLIEAMR